MKDAFNQLISNANKAAPVPESIAKYVDALVKGTHEITEVTIRPKRTLTVPAWEPIETAPKDGTDVLVMYVHIDTQIVHNGFWIGSDETCDEADIGWWSYEHSEVSRIKLDSWMTPTHWLPLPKLKEKNS